MRAVHPRPGPDPKPLNHTKTLSQALSALDGAGAAAALLGLTAGAGGVAALPAALLAAVAEDAAERATLTAAAPDSAAQRLGAYLLDVALAMPPPFLTCGPLLQLLLPPRLQAAAVAVAAAAAVAPAAPTGAHWCAPPQSAVEVAAAAAAALPAAVRTRALAALWAVGARLVTAPGPAPCEGRQQLLLGARLCAAAVAALRRLGAAAAAAAAAEEAASDVAQGVSATPQGADGRGTRAAAQAPPPAGSAARGGAAQEEADDGAGDDIVLQPSRSPAPAAAAAASGRRMGGREGSGGGGGGSGPDAAAAALAAPSSTASAAAAVTPSGGLPAEQPPLSPTSPLLPAWRLRARVSPAHSAAVVSSIRQREFGVGVAAPPEVAAVLAAQAARLQRALTRLAADLYASRVHLLLELLQNADDCRWEGTGAWGRGR